MTKKKTEKKTEKKTASGTDRAIIDDRLYLEDVCKDELASARRFAVLLNDVIRAPIDRDFELLGVSAAQCIAQAVNASLDLLSQAKYCQRNKKSPRDGGLYEMHRHAVAARAEAIDVLERLANRIQNEGEGE